MPQEKVTPLQKKLVQIRRDAEERDAERRATASGLPYVNLGKVPISVEAVRLVSEADAKDARLAVIEIKTHELAVAAFDPGSLKAKAIAKALEVKGFKTKFFVTSLSSLAEAWRLYGFVQQEAGEITGGVEIKKKHLEDLLLKLKNLQTVQNEIKKIDFVKSTTTDLFEIFLAGALANQASDIHFEAEEKEAKVRYRLDGLLHDVLKSLPLKNYENLLSRIKLLSGLKINVYSEPQDGRFAIHLPEKEIEVRVSVIPSDFGETIVMRILDPDAIKVDLSGLGLREDDVTLVKEELSKPNGLILNTGPTGSGKTTTLYTFLRQIVSSEIKIITIEDPIEYRIESIEQTQVAPDANYTFANGLRAILRQDPDAILVGEIRDLETADIAMQASLTGHLVFSTLHTNSAIGTVPRLVDLGVKPATIGPALTLTIAQRLVRKLCTCKKKAKAAKDLDTKISKFLARMPARIKPEAYKDYTLYEPVGCPDCSGIGYRGRIGVFEFLKGGAEFEETILNEASEVALRRLAQKQEMVLMQEDGILKVLRGETSLKELEEITGPIAW